MTKKAFIWIVLVIVGSILLCLISKGFPHWLSSFLQYLYGFYVGSRATSYYHKYLKKN